LQIHVETSKQHNKRRDDEQGARRDLKESKVNDIYFTVRRWATFKKSNNQKTGHNATTQSDHPLQQVKVSLSFLTVVQDQGQW
jgi:hypothetical protein